MSPGRLIVVAFVVVSAASWTGEQQVVAATGTARPDLPPDEDLNNAGVDMRRVGNDKAARDLFQQAYDMTHSPRATAQLGIAYQALGRWELAEPLVEKALQSPSDPWINKYLEPLQRALAVIKKHVARVEITGEPAGAEVTVNGSPAGHLPLPSAVTVAIGTVDIRVRAPGFQPESRKLNLTTQQYEHVFVQLDPASSAASGGGRTPHPQTGDAQATATTPDPKTPVAPATEPSTGSQTRRILKGGSLGLAAAGLGTGIIATVIHQQKLSEFQKADGGHCRERDGTGVDSSTGMALVACQSPLDAYRSAHTWQIVGFVAGGVFAVTWLVLELTEPAGSPPTQSASAGWTCLPSADHPGAACALRF
jgi:hypothetical protein